MNRRRLAVAALALGLAAALAAAARPALLSGVVAPVALLAWLLLRLFVLSIHQGVLWVLAVAAVVAAAIHALRAVPAPPPAPTPLDDARDPVDRWRSRIAARADGVPTFSWGWDDLVALCLQACALERRVVADHRLHDAVRAGEVPLPPNVHAHLFPPMPRRPEGRLRRLLAGCGGAFRAALRGSRGARAERLRATADVLEFLERSSGGGDRWRS